MLLTLHKHFKTLKEKENPRLTAKPSMQIITHLLVTENQSFLLKKKAEEE